MSKRKVSYFEAIEALEQEKKVLEKRKVELMKVRKDEILQIIEKTNAIEVPNNLLAGALLFLNDKKNETHPILEEFKSYLPSAKNRRNTNASSAKGNSKKKESSQEKDALSDTK